MRQGGWGEQAIRVEDEPRLVDQAQGLNGLSLLLFFCFPKHFLLSL